VKEVSILRGPVQGSQSSLLQGVPGQRGGSQRAGGSESSRGRWVEVSLPLVFQSVCRGVVADWEWDRELGVRGRRGKDEVERRGRVREGGKESVGLAFGWGQCQNKCDDG